MEEFEDGKMSEIHDICEDCYESLEMDILLALGMI
jgi:hypothetical protein